MNIKYVIEQFLKGKNVKWNVISSRDNALISRNICVAQIANGYIIVNMSKCNNFTLKHRHTLICLLDTVNLKVLAVGNVPNKETNLIKYLKK